MAFYHSMALVTAAIALLAMLASFFHYRYGVIFWAALVLSSLVQLADYFFTMGIYSLSGIVPTCAIAALFLSICQLFTCGRDRCTSSCRPLWSGLFVALLALLTLLAEPVPHDSFMMTYLFAMAFFLSRPLCLGLTCYAVAGGLDSLLRGGDRRIAHISRDAALLATIVFLVGEIFGSYWSFVGWGTTWRWTGNFYSSSMLFVLYMLALHIPRRFFSSHRAHAVAFVLPLILVLLFMVLSKVVSL
ncbi:hypothetical protein [Desulfotalea psychrophila]|uniref:Cytochrome c assembly protein domain-containing protein n=1 Tax=Desulfotalea psychrophila (strain LSv54 / DSM 12343) TaxID=177439 RepID=Q6AIX4_DESPS|nr:hypothetical protein [Desulfotalea psychrophila]CAG37706.1 unknown protein [Desulfotalea psychrophila LSv54]